MLNVLFVAALTVGLSALLYWGARTLPAERWQMLASVPIEKTGDGCWRGLNLTYYGFFSATGTTFGFAITMLLLGSIHVSLLAGLAIALFLMWVCLPASRLIAGVVEGKRNTFTVAGAAFVATLALPWLVLALPHLVAAARHSVFPPAAILAAIIIGYSFGESIGRLACLSFGCCYGLPLPKTPAYIARLFSRHNIVFGGATKKAVFSSGLAGEPLVPVQVVTSAVFAIAALVGTVLFLNQQFRTAAMVTVVVSCAWRAASEFLRGDFRGSSRISAYQWMAVFSAVYMATILALLPAGALPAPDLADGLRQFNSLPIFLGIQCCWILLFLYYGRSRVTASTLSFHVVQEQI